MAPRAYAYDAANQLTSATPAGGTARTFGYDAAGNQQTDSTGYSATYNALSQTISFQQGTNSLTNTYTGSGQAQRTHASSEATYANTLLGVTSATANPPLGVLDFQSNNLANGQSSFIRDPDGDLLGLTTNTPGPLGNTITHYTYATDQQGSVSAIYNAGQAQTAGYPYDPYGNTTAAAGSTTANPLTFQGQYQDNTGLYHMGQRYYNPVIGAWTQQDPLPQPEGPARANRYAYAGDSPVNYADPSGRCFILNCNAYHHIGQAALGAFSVGENATWTAIAGIGAGVVTSTCAVDTAASAGAAAPVCYVAGALVGGAAFAGAVATIKDGQHFCNEYIK